MEEVLAVVKIALPVVIKYAPELVTDIKLALQKAGYTDAQIEEAFSGLVPYEKLGIDESKAKDA